MALLDEATLEDQEVIYISQFVAAPNGPEAYGTSKQQPEPGNR